jgi:predicted metal-binding membrane protein
VHVPVLTLVPKPDPVDRPPPLGSIDPIWTAAILLAGAVAAWIATVGRMAGMDAAPGASLGTLGWFTGIWVTMMAAMMLPSVEPTVLLFARVSQVRRRAGRAPLGSTAYFVASYLAVWTAFGLLAFALYRLVVDAHPALLAWDRGGRDVAGAAIVAAGLYELTPLKDACLRHCRNPFHFLFFGWRDGVRGSVRMGLEHGSVCVGCCLGLMTALFALGVMSLAWMAVVSGVIFVEKVFVLGSILTRAVAIALVGLGLWVAIAPGTVPGLVQPGAATAVHMS